jgi:hypothetical protein
MLSKALKPVHDEHGESETVARWRYYLEQTRPEYANPHRFASTFRRWERQAEPMSPYSIDPSKVSM